MSKKVVIGQQIVDESSITGERDPDNFYQTPEQLVNKALLVATDHYNIRYGRGLDVGAGMGAWKSFGKIFVTYHAIEKNKKRFKDFLHMDDIDGYTNVFFKDFLDHEDYYHAIVGNPPYKRKLTIDIVLHALEHASHLVMFLLPTNFRHSEERFEMLYETGRMPSYVYDLAQRPSFTGNGSYPGEYALFVWQPNTFPCHEYKGRMLKWR